MNPWTALINAPMAQVGKAPRKQPSAPSMSDSADGYTAKAAAAMVITYSGIADRPHVRLVPIVAINFGSHP